MESEHVVISDLTSTIDRVYNIVENFMFDVRMKKENEVTLRLLAEESITFLKDIVDGRESIFWIEGDRDNCKLVFLCKKELDSDKKNELLSMSSSGTNKAYSGLSGKIKSLFANPDDLSSKWTLSNYKKKVSASGSVKKSHDEADDIERTIIASKADDIEVSIEKDRIKMVVIKNFD